MAIADLSLPDADGHAVVHAVRAAHPDMALLVLTGCSDEELALWTLAEGAQDYLIKGQHDGPGLATALLHALQRQRTSHDDNRYLEMARLATELSGLDYALPGSFARRYTTCAKRECQCRAEPPTLHGPYLHWTRTVGGTTVTRTLTEDQARRYQPWVNNGLRLRELTSELEARSLRLFEANEG